MERTDKLHMVFEMYITTYIQSFVIYSSKQFSHQYALNSIQVFFVVVNFNPHLRKKDIEAKPTRVRTYKKCRNHN